MFFWVHFPPKSLGERGIPRAQSVQICVVAYPLQIIKVFGWNQFKHFSHPRHGKWGEPIARAGAVEALPEVSHELAPLGIATRFLAPPYRYIRADVLHMRIVLAGTGVWKTGLTPH